MLKFIEVQITEKELYDWSVEEYSEMFIRLNEMPNNHSFRFDFKHKDDLEVFRKIILVRALTRKIKIKTELNGLSLYVSKK